MARAATMENEINTLIGSPEESVLQRTIVDLDSVDPLQSLLSKESRTLRHKTVLAMANSGKEQRLTRKAKEFFHRIFLGVSFFFKS